MNELTCKLDKEDIDLMGNMQIGKEDSEKKKRSKRKGRSVMKPGFLLGGKILKIKYTNKSRGFNT